MKPSQKKVIVTGFISLLHNKQNHFDAFPVMCHAHVISGCRIIGVMLPMVSMLAYSKLTYMVERHNPDINYRYYTIFRVYSVDS